MAIGGISPISNGTGSNGADSNGMGVSRSVRLTPQEQVQVRKLRQIDQKVRAHEQAHLGAAAGLAVGGASFQTVRGPDGRQYAVAGEVSIDVSPAQSPRQTIDKARRIQAAALAPADPSAQDRAVAAAAASMQIQASAQLAREQREATQAEAGGTATGNPALAAYAALEPAPEPALSLFA